MDRFRRMKIFVAVVEAGQLTRAADKLLLSKSAVSHALTDLEKHLDLQLFLRNNRKWQLTDAGSNYYAQCKKIITDVEAMEDEVRKESQTLSGLIRLSSPITYCAYTLAPLIAKFMDMHPQISIELNLTDRTMDMLENRVDISFRGGNIKSRFLEAHKIGESPIMVCASPAYLEKFGTPKTHLDLKNHKCIRYSRVAHWRFMKDGRKFEVMPKDHILTDTGQKIREFCLQGQGLCYLPAMQTDYLIKQGRLVQVFTDYDFGTMPIHAVRIANIRVSNRVLQFLHFIISELNGSEVT